ncbi:MAG: outer membrane protein transport protein [Motiliproteus sp.]
MKRILTSVVAALSAMGSVSVSAGGLWLNEYGSPAMGRARAGAEAGVNDASTVLHNPASMTRLDKEQWMATGGLIVSEAEFELERSGLIAGSDPGDDAGGVIPGAAFFYVMPIDERWDWGLSVGGSAGAALDYRDSWAGRFQAKSVDLVALAVSPAVAYRVNDWLSIGGAAQLMYTELEIVTAVRNPGNPGNPDGEAKIDGDDLETSFSLGAVIEWTERTRFGLVYQHEFTPNYSGDVELNSAGLSVGADTELTLASFFRLGMSHQLTDNLGIHGTIGWEDWSSMGNINISTDTFGLNIETGWEDTYHYAAGLDYRLNDDWLISTGIAYDTNPVSSQDRTAQLPVDRQLRYALGAQYRYGQQFSWGSQLVYADLGDAAIDAPLFAGHYKTNRFVFWSVNANWLY